MDPNAATIVIQIINFLIFAAIITKFIYRPVLLVLDNRKAGIEKEREEAENLKASAMSLKDEYEQKLREARRAAQDLINEATRSAEVVKNDIVSEARREAQREKERAAEEMRSEQEKAQKEMRSSIADLSVALADKVLKETIDQTSQKRIMEEFIRKVESGNAV
ncbi:MAG: F0F1 ATP synthase subunit B [Vulcanimicrobiota bacterium]